MKNEQYEQHESNAAAVERQAAPDNLVELDQPITRGAQRIEALTLRKPRAGELRGVHLLDLLQFDVAATLKVLPRISQPSISETEAAAMDLADVLACGQVIAGFLLQKRQKADASLIA